MSELNFKDLEVSKDLDALNLETLCERESAKTPILETWKPGKRPSRPFNKYTEYVVPIDDHSDVDAYMNTLDFEDDTPAEDSTLTDADIEEITNEVYIIALNRFENVDANAIEEVASHLGFNLPTSARIAAFWTQQKEELEADEDSLYSDVDNEVEDTEYGDLDDYDFDNTDDPYEEYEESLDPESVLYNQIYQVVRKDFDNFLENNPDFNELSTNREDVDFIVDMVAKDYYSEMEVVDQNIIDTELQKPHFFDNAFASYLSRYFLATSDINGRVKERFQIPTKALEEAQLEERTVYQKKSDVLGFVIMSKDTNDFATWDDEKEIYTWSRDLQDAEFFETDDDAEIAMGDFNLNGELHAIYAEDLYATLEPVKKAPYLEKLLREARISDIEAVCEEFVHEHPRIRGELSVRLAHQLKQKLVDILYINPMLAYSIAEEYLESRFGAL